MSCRVSAGNICGLETVTIENSLVKALIAAGKGADLLEFVYKPLEINCLYRSETPFDEYLGRDLAADRLKSHTEMGLGGWMTVLPHRARYKNIELTQETGGVAATVPWRYRVGEDSVKAAAVTFFTDLPLTPIHIEKTFTLVENSAKLRIDESVTFNGDEPIVFTWTEHALFGGNFVDEDTTVMLPSQRVFDAWAHMAQPEKEPESFEHPACAAPLRKGVYDLRRPLPSFYNGSEFLVFKDLNEGMACLYNKNLNLSVTLTWDKSRFPFMRSLYRSEGFCVVGLEPGDDMFSGLEHSLKYGTVTKMKPGEKIETGFTLGFSTDGGE